jgi:BirA family transcriptional regulator, biotin operon repressor / biotin---[acetyl-CoA-carboxylase] ligase
LPHRTTILQDKTPLAIGNVFTEFESIDSTNNYATAQAHAGKAFHGNVFFAYEQTAGKGQRGKKWIAATGENIMMSIILEQKRLSINEQFLLSACIALGCFDLLNKYLPEEISIKWPNDLYIRDRKAGGILIENILSGDNWRYAIVGIGININQTKFDKGLANPVSLKQATGKIFEVIDLAKELCGCIEKRYNQLEIIKRDEMIAEYNQHLYKRNKQVRLKKGNEIFETIIKEVSPQGKLITVDEEERSFDFGEVVWEV